MAREEIARASCCALQRNLTNDFHTNSCNKFGVFKDFSSAFESVFSI